MKIFTLTLALALAVAAPAFAADDTTVHVPWGQYVAEAILALGAVAGGIVGHLTGLLPGPARWGVQVMKIDQVAQKAISAAAFDLAKDIQSKGFTVDVRNAMLAQALNVFQANAADLFARYKETVSHKLKARIEEYIDQKTAAARA